MDTARHPAPSSPRRWILRGLLAAAGLAAAAAAFGAWRSLVTLPRADEAALGLVRVDLPAPDFELPSADGATFVLSEHRGEVLIVNFWASWCPPCRAEFPSLLRLARALEASHPGRVRVVAVSVDEDWTPVRSFFGGRIPRGATLALDAGQEATRAFYCGARGACPQDFPLPETHVVDPSGRLVGYVAGPRDWMVPSTRRWIERLVE